MKNKERTTFEIIKRFLAPMLKTPAIYLQAVLAYFIWSLGNIIIVLFLKQIVGALELGNKILFQDILIYYFTFLLIYEVIYFLTRNYGWSIDGPQIARNIQDQYIKKFIKLDNNYIEVLGTGKIIAIISEGFKEWGANISFFLEKSIKLLVSLAFAIFMLLQVSVVCTLIFIFLYIFFQIIAGYLNLGMLRWRRKRKEANDMYIKHLVRIIMSKLEVLQSEKVEKELKRLDDYLVEDIYCNRKMVPYVHGFFRLPSGMIAFFIYFVFFYFGHMVFDGSLALSTLVGLTGALIIMENTINDSIIFYKDLTKRFTIIEKLWNFFENTPEIKGYEEGKSFKHKTGAIEIKNISYGYTKDKPVFKDFNLKIVGEKVTAIVGNSGSGKSTFIKLIAGYIRADFGEIIIDGQKLKEVSLKSYYKDIGYLTQEPSVFDGTVYDNLTYAINIEEKGKLKNDSYDFNKKLEEIIKLAKCEFIYDLPNGLQTEIGERGIRLSGGQRQRLAIAKIFLKDPKIILLDEPTSALDSFSEEQITEAMHNLFKGRTIIVIAHRLQTVKNADDIILLEDGKIKERGTHKELIHKNGIYKRMLDLQSGF